MDFRVYRLYLYDCEICSYNLKEKFYFSLTVRNDPKQTYVRQRNSTFISLLKGLLPGNLTGEAEM